MTVFRVTGFNKGRSQHGPWVAYVEAQNRWSAIHKLYESTVVEPHVNVGDVNQWEAEAVLSDIKIVRQDQPL